MEPAGVCVVEEGDDRLEPDRGQVVHEPSVACERLVVELAPSRLDAAPGDGESEGIGPERGGEKGVLLVAAPRVRGAPARTAVGPARGLPVGPVARVVPFDLVMGDADPPEAGAVGERERGSGTRSHHGAMASTSGIAAASTIPTARFVSWVTHFKPTCVAVP
jgi:hypothetical protein